jgi:hypothetical protein
MATPSGGTEFWMLSARILIHKVQSAVPEAKNVPLTEFTKKLLSSIAPLKISLPINKNVTMPYSN